MKLTITFFDSSVVEYQDVDEFYDDLSLSVEDKFLRIDMNDFSYTLVRLDDIREIYVQPDEDDIEEDVGTDVNVDNFTYDYDIHEYEGAFPKKVS